MSTRETLEKILGSIMCVVYGILLAILTTGKITNITFTILIFLGIVASIMFAISYFFGDQESTIPLLLKWLGIGIGYLVPLLAIILYLIINRPITEFIADPTDPTGLTKIKNPQWIQLQEQSCQKQIEFEMSKVQPGFYPIGHVIKVCDKEYVVE